MTSILQVSDPHFGTETAPVVDALLRLQAQLAPDVVVLSGDLTQRATTAQFARAHEFVQQLTPSRCFAIPGNHDIPLYNLWARLMHPYAAYHQDFGDHTGFTFANDAVQLTGINTTRRYRHKHGEVSAAQIEAVCQRLATAHEHQCRIIITHQPVDVLRDTDEQNLLRGAATAVQAWADAGADLILGGHIHQPAISKLSDRYPMIARPVWSILAGTAVSTRTRHGVPNSVNHLKCLPGRQSAIVERWDYDVPMSEFRLETTLEIELVN